MSHPSLTFNNILVAQTSSQKHLGMHLDKKLNFEEHLSKVETKVNKSVDNIPTYFAMHDYFKNSVFPSAITEWNKLDCLVKNADSFHVFKKHILDFIRPLPNSIFNIHNPLGIKYLTRLRIGFSHLKEHKFRHNFQDSVDPMCSCGSGTETTKYFFLHCPNFHLQRQTLFDKIATIDSTILTENEESILNTLLLGKLNSENSFSKAILNASIEFYSINREIQQSPHLILIPKTLGVFYLLKIFFFFVNLNF